jgi:toxin YoeB
MSYRLDFSLQAQNDIQYHKNSGNKAVLRKLHALFMELAEHPLKGTGKPEALKYELNGLRSRRINSEHRLTYEIINDRVLIHAARGHY